MTEDDRAVGIRYACETPERYDRRHTAFCLECRPCMVALGVAAFHHPDDTRTHWDSGVEGETMRLADIYTEARGMHSLPPLPDGART